MSLVPGMRLGAYEIAAPIGEGGMGQVYRATDTKLKRQVAIKVLAPELAHDADRLARFQREAEVLAALNHPHIAGIYGVEETDGVQALVMEFVQGEDLAQQIARGPLPAEDAIRIAREITEALEAAHERGIVHRDLKPANIKIREDGTVKVLDFGLAKAKEPASASPSVSMSPTIAMAGVTQRGIILGTAAYMSPEQARGKLADHRSDIWAFGCVLYEMLTGTRAFAGEEITDVLAAVVRDEPDWSRLPPNTPAAIQRLLRRSLRKDRNQRLADISDARLELEEVREEQASSVAATSRARGGRGRLWAAAAVVVSFIALAAFGIRSLRTPPPDNRIARFEIAAPPGGHLEWGQPMSPDGRTIAFISVADGQAQVWVRPLDSGSARPLPGTERATRSFWSPDSQRVAFFSDGDLKEVGIDGREPRLIVRGPFRDGAWSTGGIILVGGQLGQPLMRVSELGGTPTAETTLDKSLDEVSHDYPEFLPDGRHYVYLSRRGVRSDDFVTYVGTLGSPERRELPGILAAAKYSPSGHLLFLRGTTLMAQAFSLERLELSGDAFPVALDVGGTRVATFSTAANGTLAFIGGFSPDTELVWFNRSGARLGVAGPKGAYSGVSLAPDSRSVAFDRGSPADVWMLDLQRQAAGKVTSDRAADRLPIWSPDGETLAFVSDRGGVAGIYQRALAAGEDRQLMQSAVPLELSDWSRDGRYLAYSASGDIWALPLADPGTPLRVTTSPFFQEFNARFSPDGRWIAYQSDESRGVTRSGEGDIFVQSFPPRGVARQVSTGGGFAPRWSDDGQELFYLAASRMLTSVPLTPRGSSVDIGTPRPLFSADLEGASVARPMYSVSRDGRFLMRVSRSALSITVIINWFEQLKRGAAGK